MSGCRPGDRRRDHRESRKIRDDRDPPTEGGENRARVAGTRHGLGLDVHGVWPWLSREMRRGLTFKPGMVLTMEPGLYFPFNELK
ncbi:MAG: M24 family metallopeptidase [Candidatus Aminicenantes bacterium]|nr:M24 family metallopeptidase [Candidatus Aminicenantes bacterium]